MNAPTFDMRSLLQEAGFTVRGGMRADCAYCEGHSSGTVAFTGEVAFCHRCNWLANTVTLARDLGLLRGNTEWVESFREKARKRVHLDAEVKHFETWRDGKIREVSDRYRSLSRAVVFASTVLEKFSDCEPAWVLPRGSRAIGIL